MGTSTTGRCALAVNMMVIASRTQEREKHQVHCRCAEIAIQLARENGCTCQVARSRTHSSDRETGHDVCVAHSHVQTTWTRPEDNRKRTFAQELSVASVTLVTGGPRMETRATGNWINCCCGHVCSTEPLMCQCSCRLCLYNRHRLHRKDQRCQQLRLSRRGTKGCMVDRVRPWF